MFGEGAWKRLEAARAREENRREVRGSKSDAKDTAKNIM